MRKNYCVRKRLKSGTKRDKTLGNTNGNDQTSVMEKDPKKSQLTFY
jgi:hypothetical protein